MEVLIRLILVFVVLVLTDLYTVQAIKRLVKPFRWPITLFWLVTVSCYLYMAWASATFDRADYPHKVVNTFMGILVLGYVPKFVLILFLLVEDFIRLSRASARKIISLSRKKSRDAPFVPERRKFVSQVALAAAAVPFISIFHGMWKGKYNFRTIAQKIYIPNLSTAFEGLRIVQISDIHAGSFNNAEKVAYGVDMINGQRGDVLVFTGDLVNNRSREMEPWIEVFSRLKAPLGKFSILGNHDYGDYVSWPDHSTKENNMLRLYEIHKEMGFDLLRNQHRTLERDGQKLVIAGVENWGNPPFPQHGDVDKALEGTPADSPVVMLSHDPSHFDEVIKHHPRHIALTLSGHTHGMQFGIEIPGWIKWSPVKFRYPKWAGLYEDRGRKLYVNRGFGYLAFPGRVGIWPEITVLELTGKPTTA